MSCWLGHVCSFLGCRSGSGPCRSALRCGRPEPAKDGRLHRSDPAEPAGQVCGQAGFDLSRRRACPRAGRLGRPPRGATAALKRPAAGLDRSEQEGQSSTARYLAPAGRNRRGQTRHADDIEAGQVQHQWLRFRACLCRRTMQRSLVAMLQFTDDTLLHSQPAADHVEFDPMLEGEAVDELLMASTTTRSATRSAPGFHRRRLPSRARCNLPGETFQMPKDLSAVDDCFCQRFRSAVVDHGPSPGLRQPMKEDGLSTDKLSAPVANSTPEISGVGAAMFDWKTAVTLRPSDRSRRRALRGQKNLHPADRPDPQPRRSALPDPRLGRQHDRHRRLARPRRQYP